MLVNCYANETMEGKIKKQREKSQKQIEKITDEYKEKDDNLHKHYEDLRKNAISFYENGKAEKEEVFKNGEKIGENYNYGNGNVKYEIPLFNDKKEGIEKVYYANGKLKEEIAYKNDKKEGISKFYDIRGKIEGQIEYKDDKITNEKWFFENGTIDRDTSVKKECLLMQPIENSRTTSDYGWRIHPVKGYIKNHKGIDYSAKTGTPIYAAGNGIIRTAVQPSGAGNYVVITHSGNCESKYFHLSKFAVKNGDKVEAGQIIGYSGKTGTATAPHLHYEVFLKNKNINPNSVTKIPYSDKYYTGKI
ncbi:MAG: peptidoglycan DD-metalloendopeptidase family protein [Rickettsiales bacterium]|nr:peptidoglycan DD-metalloendopeptidase family protein [Rickettsiales bacterium]